MKASYQGNAKPFVLALFAPVDQETVLPILQELDAKGLNLCYRQKTHIKKRLVNRACTVIAFHSAQSMADDRFEDAILLAKSADVPLVCVKLDHTPFNDSLNRLLYTSNIISADRYATPALLAERVMTAESLAHPTLTEGQIHETRRIAIALITGAVLIVIAAGLIIWQRINAANHDPVETPIADVAGILSSGMTEEDLLKIRSLVIVGDTMVNVSELREYWTWNDVISQMTIDGETVWSIDGIQIPRGTATDISLIGKMSNLEHLSLLNQSITDLSPLQSLTKLAFLQLVDCPVENIDAISGLPELRNVILELTDVNDLTPLQTCGALENFFGTIGRCESIEGLNNPNLQDITLYEANQITNLDALSVCNNLIDLTITGATALTDISGLSGCTSLKTLYLENASLVRSSSAFSNITTLKQVEIRYSGFTELSGLKQSRGLQTLRLEEVPVGDFSWTSGMNELTTFQAHGTYLRNFNFLNDLGVSSMELHFSGDINDYSGLSAISHYSLMHLNPGNGNVSAVLPYIANASFTTLWLYDCNGIDFSALPSQVNNLWISNGNLSSLEGLSAASSLNSITLESVDRLSSLAGLAECEGISCVILQNCDRLTDFEDLYLRPYGTIELINLPVSPDLSRLQIADYGYLVFDSMPCITDISPLTAIQTHIDSLSIRNMDTVTNISAINNMKVLELVVPPQLEEQAKQLRDDEVIDGYSICYPTDELWGEETDAFVLLSLEELDTLPDGLLSRVIDFTIVGDSIPDTETQDWTEQWDDEGQHFYLVDRVTGELTPVGPGVIDQIDPLTKMNHLQCLRLYDQPLTSLQGIQAFSDLKLLEVRKCPVVDASAAFTLTQLETLSLFATQVSSIQGIQNLTKLTRLDLSSSQVSDINPLKECNFDYAAENGGLSLDISYMPCEEFSALKSIPSFSALSIGGHEAVNWLPYLEGTPCIMLDANGADLTNDQIVTIAALPQLTELMIGWNEQVTDLSPLLSCDTLTKLIINQDNAEAIASIEGKAQFTIEYY